MSVGNLKNVTSRTELQNYSYVNNCRQQLLCWGIFENGPIKAGGIIIMFCGQPVSDSEIKKTIK